MRSPHTMGEECERPGIAMRQSTFLPAAMSHSLTVSKPSAIPLACGPRNCGQFASRGGVFACWTTGNARNGHRSAQENSMRGETIVRRAGPRIVRAGSRASLALQRLEERSAQCRNRSEPDPYEARDPDREQHDRQCSQCVKRTRLEAREHDASAGHGSDEEPGPHETALLAEEEPPQLPARESERPE